MSQPHEAEPTQVRPEVQGNLETPSVPLTTREALERTSETAELRANPNDLLDTGLYPVQPLPENSEPQVPDSLPTDVQTDGEVPDNVQGETENDVNDQLPAPTLDFSLAEVPAPEERIELASKVDVQEQPETLPLPDSPRAETPVEQPRQEDVQAELLTAAPAEQVELLPVADTAVQAMIQQHENREDQDASREETTQELPAQVEEAPAEVQADPSTEVPAEPAETPKKPKPKKENKRKELPALLELAPLYQNNAEAINPMNNGSITAAYAVVQKLSTLSPANLGAFAKTIEVNESSTAAGIDHTRNLLSPANGVETVESDVQVAGYIPRFVDVALGTLRQTNPRFIEKLQPVEDGQSLATTYRQTTEQSAKILKTFKKAAGKLDGRNRQMLTDLFRDAMKTQNDVTSGDVDKLSLNNMIDLAVKDLAITHPRTQKVLEEGPAFLSEVENQPYALKQLQSLASRILELHGKSRFNSDTIKERIALLSSMSRKGVRNAYDRMDKDVVVSARSLEVATAALNTYFPNQDDLNRQINLDIASAIDLMDAYQRVSDTIVGALDQTVKPLGLGHFAARRERGEIRQSIADLLDFSTHFPEELSPEVGLKIRSARDDIKLTANPTASRIAEINERNRQYPENATDAQKLAWDVAAAVFCADSSRLIGQTITKGDPVIAKSGNLEVRLLPGVRVADAARDLMTKATRQDNLFAKYQPGNVIIIEPVTIGNGRNKQKEMRFSVEADTQPAINATRGLPSRRQRRQERANGPWDIVTQHEIERRNNRSTSLKNTVNAAGKTITETLD